MPTIVCDESGSEGENLMLSSHPNFVHASINIPVARAAEVVSQLRDASGSRARELKSRAALSAQARSTLVDIVAEFAPDANICLVDKSYFTSAKLVDLIVAEQAYRNGVDLAKSGEAAEMARSLHQRAPVALGPSLWRELLVAFNQLVRRHVREGDERPSPAEFFTLLDVARSSSSDGHLTVLLEGLWRAKYLVADYDQERDGGIDFREMDPMITTLVSVARTWGVRLNGQPFEFLVDNYWGLDRETRAAIASAASIPIAFGSVEMPVGDLRSIEVADSLTDPRVQVADVFAGVGRVIADIAGRGVFDDPLQVAAHEALDFNGMWVPGSALDQLVEHGPLAYFESWAARRREEGES